MSLTLSAFVGNEQMDSKSLIVRDHGCRLHQPRCRPTTAVIAVPGVNVSRFNVGVGPESFELLCTRITSGSSASIVLLIYRPGSVSVTPAFFGDLFGTLERVVGYNEPIYIVGNPNARLDRDYDSNARQLTDLFDAFRFVVRRQSCRLCVAQHSFVG